MSRVLILLLVLLLIHIVISIYTIVRINSTNLLSPPQKRINSWLTICIPFLWPLLMYYMLKKGPLVFNEEEQHDHTTHDFHESGKGFYH